MRTIAIMNQKGGVGKTTTAVNLAAALAAADRRVCVVDLDPQAHATLHLGVDVPDGRTSMYDVMVGDASFADACYPAGERLTVAASTLDLAAAGLALGEREGRELVLCGKLRARPPEADFLLIDCPPSLGLLTLNALAAVDEVLIPLQPQFLALHGLGKLLETIQAVAVRLNPALRLTGVAFCMYDTGTRLATEVRQDVEAFFQAARGSGTPWAKAVAFRTRIRRNIRLAEAPSFGQSIFQYAAKSHGAEDYQALADELLKTA
ncbi:MAG: ParA family protein [Patescibacteria group bacterium]|nr:ParA family protein [Patescibacteria group bacterium]